MNWIDPIKQPLKELFKKLSGLETVWEDEPRPFIPPGPAAIVLLSVINVRGQGQDEQIRHYDSEQENGKELQDEWRGNRQFTLTVKVESLIQTSNGSAPYYLSQIRDALPFRSTRAVFLANNVAVIQALPTVDLGETRDDRRWSIHAMDILFQGRKATLDPERYGYVDKVEINGTVIP